MFNADDSREWTRNEQTTTALKQHFIIISNNFTSIKNSIKPNTSATPAAILAIDYNDQRNYINYLKRDNYYIISVSTVNEKTNIYRKDG